jgi:hypothetical protein
VEEAKRGGWSGVATLVSDGPWMAGKEVFLSNGLTRTAERDRFELVFHRLKEGDEPRFRSLDGNAAPYRGLHIVYADQCPMLSKSAHDLSEMAAQYGLTLRVTVLKSACAAQNAPTFTGVFSLLYDGRLLADHYVSQGRFRNILRKELLNGKK